MPKQTKTHLLYKGLLYLYPTKHRKEYGPLMLHTLDDMLDDNSASTGKLSIWGRVLLEIPFNLIEEHIHNLEDKKMVQPTKSRNIILGTSIAVIAIIAMGVWFLTRTNDYTPTTLANVKKQPASIACLAPADITGVSPTKEQTELIGNAVASSIIDVPAGTNVDVHFKTITSDKASGTSVYTGSYGSYNFIAQKKPDDAQNSYIGGWVITELKPCK